MKKLIKIFTSRLVVTGLLILVQLGWLLLQLFHLTQYATWLAALFSLLSLLAILFLIQRDENPAYKLLWVILIALAPLFGGLLYLVLGNKQPTRRMRHTLAQARAPLEPLLTAPNEEAIASLEAKHPRMCSTARYIGKSGPYPLQQNTRVTYYPIGEQLFAAMLKDLKQAQKTIYLEYFIFAEGEMWQAMRRVLVRKAAEGVDVRLMYDDMGSLGVLPKHFQAELERDGIQCMAFNRFIPVLSLAMNHRDHRKILVIDGKVAFTGGINIADEYINQKVRFGHWKDTGVRLEGDGAWNFTLMFLELWNAYKAPNALPPQKPEPAPALPGGGWVQPFSDSPVDEEPVSENVYLDILNQARDYVTICTPYLIIDNEMQTALCLAAKRGVDISIITPGIPDKWLVWQMTRSYYEPLMKAGVKIYEYTPGFIHAKSYLSDDCIGVVGTINMDYRSLYLHFECGTLLIDTPALADLKADCLDTIAKSRRMKPEDVRPGFWGRLLSAVLRVFAPLM